MKSPNFSEFNGTKKAFDELILNKSTFFHLFVLEFFEPSSRPCQEFKLDLPMLTEEYPSIAFIQINVKNSKEVAEFYNITEYPTILFFVYDYEILALEEFATVVGYVPETIVKHCDDLKAASKPIQIIKCDYEYK